MCVTCDCSLIIRRISLCAAVDSAHSLKPLPLHPKSLGKQPTSNTGVIKRVLLGPEPMPVRVWPLPELLMFYETLSQICVLKRQNKLLWKLKDVQRSSASLSFLHSDPQTLFPLSRVCLSIEARFRHTWKNSHALVNHNYDVKRQ